MTLLLRLVALFFRALTAFDRWLCAADPGEDGPDGTAGDLLAGQPCDVRLSDAERAEFNALIAEVEAERDERLGGMW